MRAFRFRLASILKLRESTRNQRLAQLAEALAAADKLRRAATKFSPTSRM